MLEDPGMSEKPGELLCRRGGASWPVSSITTAAESRLHSNGPPVPSNELAAGAEAWHVTGDVSANVTNDVAIVAPLRRINQFSPIDWLWIERDKLLSLSP